ncbi:hypothetical protein AWRIB429_1716 [Oenococcus oeni AWRIB429]|uniref:Uncharacterized protein n=1 Tax=Oenococcus oeni AWRIB429 TaxID=655225 RepID=D3LBI6_OENOE|nr:hypothetical protein AWRIB429_1716 [Oenococcus oeni AWRIB429]KZD14812.1 hypothetical protein AC229_1650 [Oenococcus oeni]
MLLRCFKQLISSYNHTFFIKEELIIFQKDYYNELDFGQVFR